MGKVLGIDLGTTNSCMAIVEGGKAKVLENKEGNRTTPSVIAMSKNGERLVGQLAKRQAVMNPQNTLHSIKRFIGRRWKDDETQADAKKLPFKVLEGKGGSVNVKMGDKDYSAPEISAMVLQKLKTDAEEKIGEKITEAVITVPAYFDDSQRQATKDAGEIAGLKVLRIINEPTAAALSYGFDQQKEQKIAVYDLGGGTFDISILELGDNTIEVKSTNGDTHLGGEDFDSVIIDWIVGEFKKEHGVDLSKDPVTLQRVKDAAEKAKHELSSAMDTEINQPFIMQDSSGTPLHLLLSLSRAKLESLVEDLVNKTLEPCKAALKDAGLTTKDIDEVVLVGGMTRMPLVQKKVEEFFGKKPNMTVNPDEVVAMGAAIQGGVLQGEVKDVLLLDVTPLSLGLETLGGVFTKLIERNTTIPTSKSQVFSTAVDNQTSVEIKIYQGERPMAADNKLLGTFILEGIPTAPRGVPQVEVSFDLDANGILHVAAKDKATNKAQSITITSSSGLSKDEIEKMKTEAQQHEEEDKKKSAVAEARNIAETVSFQAEKTLKEYGDKITAELKQQVEDKLANLNKVKSGDDIEAIKKATDELGEFLQKIGEQMYKEKDAANNAEAKPAEGEKKDGEAKDANFEA